MCTTGLVFTSSCSEMLTNKLGSAPELQLRTGEQTEKVFLLQNATRFCYKGVMDLLQMELLQTATIYKERLKHGIFLI